MDVYAGEDKLMRCSEGWWERSDEVDGEGMVWLFWVGDLLIRLFWRGRGTRKLTCLAVLDVVCNVGVEGGPRGRKAKERGSTRWAEVGAFGTRMDIVNGGFA